LPVFFYSIEAFSRITVLNQAKFISPHTIGIFEDRFELNNNFERASIVCDFSESFTLDVRTCEPEFSSGPFPRIRSPYFRNIDSGYLFVNLS
jgi:hypothetical protein